MLKRLLKKAITQCGYELRPLQSNITDRTGFRLYQYLDESGSFDYERYREVQCAGNHRKINNVWVEEENVRFLSNYIREALGSVQFGLCHGTRRGLEQKWFRKYLGCNVLGTEISDSANDYADTIQWDFHDAKKEWLGAVDFVYSNAFDHSHSPERCLNTWMSCVRPRGLCIIEHSSFHDASHVTELDPFGADIAIMPYLILQWGQGRYGVRELLSAPKTKSGVHDQYFVVIQRHDVPDPVMQSTRA